MKNTNYTIEQLLATVTELNQRLTETESKREDVKWLEASLKSRTRDLSERLKELECMHHLLQLGIEQAYPFSDGAESVIQIIRNGWQYPDLISVRIKWDDKEYRSFDFCNVLSKQTEPITVSGKHRGEIEIGYTAEKPQISQGPFLKEETTLLRSIALWISMIIERSDRDQKTCRPNQ